MPMRLNLIDPIQSRRQFQGNAIATKKHTNLAVMLGREIRCRQRGDSRLKSFSLSMPAKGHASQN
jgi:hypothetical protein